MTEKKEIKKKTTSKEKKTKDIKKNEEKPVEKTSTAHEEKQYSIRGNIFEGKVISAKARKTITVERILTQYIPKYERYKKVKSKIKAHVPTGINVKEGNIVRIGETRKISKTKNFVLMKIIK